MIKKGLISAVILAVIGFALLVSEASAFHWGQKSKIKGIYIYSESRAYITTEINENPDNCANFRYLAILPASPHFNQLYATALAAQLSGQTVSINYDGCTTDGYPIVNSVAVPEIW